MKRQKFPSQNDSAHVLGLISFPHGLKLCLDSSGITCSKEAKYSHKLVHISPVVTRETSARQLKKKKVQQKIFFPGICMHARSKHVHEWYISLYERQNRNIF